MGLLRMRMRWSIRGNDENRCPPVYEIPEGIRELPTIELRLSVNVFFKGTRECTGAVGGSVDQHDRCVAGVDFAIVVEVAVERLCFLIELQFYQEAVWLAGILIRFSPL